MSCETFCEKFEEKLYLVSDRYVAQEIRVLVEEHVAVCPFCYERWVVATKTVQIVRMRCIRSPAPKGLRRKILLSLSSQELS